MALSLADDESKNVVIYVNDFYPEHPAAFEKLCKKLGRKLRGILLVDAGWKASNKYLPDKSGLFEELVVDFFDDAALKNALKPFQDNLLLVSCDSERSQLYFRKVIPHVPYVNTPTESSIDYSTDKGEMRKQLLAYDQGISPRAFVVNDISQENIDKLCGELRFPVMVKPTNLAASMLVNKADDKDELVKVLGRSFTALKEIYPKHRDLGHKTMVVEEFVEGDLYSTDVYVDSMGKVYVLPFLRFQNGAMVGFKSYQVYQSETYHTLSAKEQEDGEVVARKAIHAIGLRSSVAHIELFHTPNGWKIVELGARPGGWRQEIYDVSYGIDHAFNILLVKIGLEPYMPSNIKTHCSTFQIHAQKAGIVESIEGVDEVNRLPQVYSIRVSVKLGDSVLPSTHGGEELMYGLMQNPDHEQLRRDRDVVRSLIKVNISPIG